MPAPLSKLLHDILQYVHDENRDPEDPGFESTVQELHARIFPRVQGLPNLAIFFSGRVIGYEKNLLNLIETFESLAQKHNLYFFTSVNGFYDMYHAKFCRIFGIGPDQRLFSIFHGNVRYYNYRRNQFTNIYNACSMWYNTYCCIRLIFDFLKKYGVYSNLVMKYRTEAIYAEAPITIESTVYPNTVYIPHGFDHTGLNDQIAYGNYDSMYKYAWLIYDLDTYIKIPGFFFHPETNLRNHLLEKGVNVHRVHFPYFFRNQLSTNPEYL